MATRNQTKMADMVLEFLWKRRQECIDGLKQLDDERKKNSKQGCFYAHYAHWAEWNFTSYIYREFKLELLEDIIQNIHGGMKRGITDDELGKFLKEVRGGYVRRVMTHTTAHSTNPVANLIEDEKIDVYRGLAGMTILDQDSLMGLLIQLKLE